VNLTLRAGKHRAAGDCRGPRITVACRWPWFFDFFAWRRAGINAQVVPGTMALGLFLPVSLLLCEREDTSLGLIHGGGL